jgi:pimeloyl-ACP methyl ester carboxylesterase
MLAVASNAGLGRYVANEWDAVLRPVSSRVARTPLVWCHGNNGTTLTDHSGYNLQLRQLAQRHTVIAADLGYNTFGNATGVTRVGQALDYLAASHGASGKAVLVGASMGGAVALNYAVRYPERVTAVVGIIPTLSLDAADASPVAANIDAAYPPAYDPANPAHLAHDPVAFADDLPAEIPVHLWTSSNDPLCLPAHTAAFLAARPLTQHTDLGPLGHAGIDVAVPLAVQWLATVANRLSA